MMSEPNADPVTHAGSLRRALIHLRLAFSLVLTPLFVWGIYLARPSAAGGALPWPHILACYLIVHVLLYGGMNAFNSYYDRDEGPIGALEAPPPADHLVLSVALACKVVALAAGLWLDLRFGLLVGVGIALSTLYSHPRWRWKERPVRAGVTILIMQGFLGVLWGYTAATFQPGIGPAPARAWPAGWTGTIGVLGPAIWTLGFYPLTGVYQIATDGPRGVRTLSVALGIRGCFLFGALVGLLGGLGVWATILARGAYPAMLASALYMAFAALYAWCWYQRLPAATPRENQRALMRLAYANGAVFTLIFLALVLFGQ
jgi:4-hydroxybenzoate polyprenyltransferase